MKTILILFGIVFLGVESGFVLEKIDGVYGQVIRVEFDAAGNIYAASNSKNHNTQILNTNSNSQRADEYTFHLFKLSPARELIWAIDLPSPIQVLDAMSVTSYGDVYFVFWNWNYTASEEYRLFGILKSGSQEVEIIEELNTFPNAFFHLDDNDNLIYARKNGIHVLKPNSTVPIPVKNLEGYVASVRPEYGVEDSLGNVYFGVFSDLLYWAALLTKDNLQEDIPEAKLFLATERGNGESLYDLVIDKNEDLWVITSKEGKTGVVKKLINDTIEIVKIDNNHPDLEVTSANDRIYVVAANIFNNVSPSIYYITLNNEVVEIPELSELTIQQSFFSDTVADKDGNIYFKTYSYFTPELGPLITIKANESKPIPIGVDDPDEIINAISMDGNGNVWIMTDMLNIYSIEKGETIATPVESGFCNDFPVVTNPVTNEVFVSCAGLYLAVDED